MRGARDSKAFDPYREWLGVAPDERPADHYRLLGIDRFEADRDVILKAADARMAHVRQFQTGPRGRFTQQLLNDLAVAKLCLLDAEKKAQYDQRLRQGGTGLAEAADSSPTGTPPMTAPGTTGWGPGFGASGGVVPPPPGVSFESRVAFPSPSAPPLPSAPATLPAGYSPAAGVGMPLTPPPPQPPPRAAIQPAAAPQAAPPSTSGSLVRPTARSRYRRRRSSGGGCVLLLTLCCVALAGVGWFIAQNRPGRPVVEPPDPAPIRRIPRPTSPQTGDSRPPVPDGPVVVYQESIGDVNLSASTADLHGSALRLGKPEQPETIVDWTDAEAWIEWQFKVVKPGVYRAEIRYEVDPDGEGGRFRLLLDGKPIHDGTLRTGDGDGAEVVQDEFFVAIRRAGLHRLALHPRHKPGRELMRLHELRLVPVTGGS